MAEMSLQVTASYSVFPSGRISQLSPTTLFRNAVDAMQHGRNEIGSVLMCGLSAGGQQMTPVITVEFHETAQVVLVCIPVIHVKKT
jgi:hypothetical protein